MIDKMFVSLTGYWLGEDEYFIRTRRIAKKTGVGL